MASDSVDPEVNKVLSLLQPGKYGGLLVEQPANLPEGTKVEATRRDVTNCIAAYHLKDGDLVYKSKANERCNINSVVVTGRVVTFEMNCVGPPRIVAKTKLSITADGFVTDAVTTVEKGNTPHTAEQHYDAKYMGPCSDKAP
ncbi:MAG: DUF3617 family protein [Usitatibacter sp.]